MKKNNIFIIPILFLIFTFCGDDDPTSPQPQLSDPVTETINAKTGGTIETEDGFSLDIPPDALLEDTEITLTPIHGNEMHEWCVKAVSLEPDGLTFEQPVTLNLPLPDDWPEDHMPIILGSFEENPADYFPFDICSELINTEKGLVAQVEIEHFSKYGPIGNCHKGSLVYLLKHFEQRGCSNADTWKKVTDKYGNINTNIDKNPQTGHETLQAMVGTYFKNNIPFEKNQKIGNKWSEITDYVKKKNRRVVVFFAKDKWDSKTSAGFYKHIPHSAVLEIKDGNLKLRNSISAGKNVKDAIIKKNGENAFWYPDGNRDITAQDLEDLRNSSPIDLLQKELEGIPGLFPNIPKRKNKPKPWTAIRFSIADRPDNINPCDDATMDFDFNKVSFDIIVNGEYSYSFQGNQFLPASLNWTGNIQFDPSTNKCYGSWDEDRPDGHYKGNIEIYFNPFINAITSYSATNQRINQYNDVYDFSIKCLETEISNTHDGDFSEYKVFGTDVCSHLDTLKYTGGDEYTGFKLVNFSCQSDSYLNIYLYKE